MDRAPCLAEDWFVEDAVASGLDKHPLLHHIDSDPVRALRMCYRMSRSIRVSHIMASNYEAARETRPDDALKVMETLAVLSLLAFEQHMQETA